MLKKIISSICVLFILSGYCYAKPTAYSFSERRPINSAVRSLILPGWGQCFNGQCTKGYIVGSLALLTLAGSYLLNDQANKTYTDYQNEGIKDSTKYDDYQTQQTQAMTASAVCAVIWIYGVIDAYANGKPKEPESAKASTFFSVACSKNQNGLYLTQKF
jgi:hypothetical protein